MDYVRNTNGTIFVAGLYKIVPAAYLFEPEGFVIMKRQTMESNDYSVIPGEHYRNAENAVKRVEQLLMSNRSINE